MVIFFRGESREDEAYFTKTNRYTNLYDPNEEQNELEVKLHDYEQEEIRFSFDNFTTKKLFRYHNIGALSYCKKPEPFCKSNSVVYIQNTEHNYCFLWFIWGHLYKVDTRRKWVPFFWKTLYQTQLRKHASPYEIERFTFLRPKKRYKDICFRINIKFWVFTKARKQNLSRRTYISTCLRKPILFTKWLTYIL